MGKKGKGGKKGEGKKRHCDGEVGQSFLGPEDGDEFEEKFRKVGRPVLLRNLTGAWPALSLWQGPTAFLARHGALKMSLRNQHVGGDNAEGRISLEEYVTNDTYRDLIVFGFNDLEAHSKLVREAQAVPAGRIRMELRELCVPPLRGDILQGISKGPGNLPRGSPGEQHHRHAAAAIVGSRC